MRIFEILHHNFTTDEAAEILNLIQAGFDSVTQFRSSNAQTKKFKRQCAGILNQLRSRFIEYEEALEELFEMFGEAMGYDNTREERKRFWSWLQYNRERVDNDDEDLLRESVITANLEAVQRFLNERQQQQQQEDQNYDGDSAVSPRRSNRESARPDSYYETPSRGRPKHRRRAVQQAGENTSSSLPPRAPRLPDQPTTSDGRSYQTPRSRSASIDPSLRLGNRKIPFTRGRKQLEISTAQIRDASPLSDRESQLVAEFAKSPFVSPPDTSIRSPVENVPDEKESVVDEVNQLRRLLQEVRDENDALRNQLDMERDRTTRLVNYLNGGNSMGEQEAEEFGIVGVSRLNEVLRPSESRDVSVGTSDGGGGVLSTLMNWM